MELISDNVQKQTITTLQNISQVLQVMHSKIENIFYLTVFVTNMSNQHKIENQLSKFFPKMKQDQNYWKDPQILFIQVNELPKNAKVEIHALSTTIDNNISNKPTTHFSGNHFLHFLLLFFLNIP